MTVYVLGVDPGKKGALSVMSERGPERIHDMPTLNLGRGGKDKLEHDPVELARLVGELSIEFKLTAAFIERVGAREHDGPSRAFEFGTGYGLVRGVIAAQYIPVVLVGPAVWKRAAGIPPGSDKDASLAAAKQRWPTAAGYFKRKLDADRAEACLIGLWGLQDLRRKAA